MDDVMMMQEGQVVKGEAIQDRAHHRIKNLSPANIQRSNGGNRGEILAGLFQVWLRPRPITPAFNGPVRKWKKKWVPSQQPNDPPVTGKPNRHPHPHRHKLDNQPPLLLCRWTRESSTANSHNDAPQPSKRKFRYTPVVVLEEKKKVASSAMKMNESRRLTLQDDMLTDNDFSEEIEEPDEDEAYYENLDLQL
ncbi:OLC1v1022635C1 [Oldenlandia corymbosa var. corymbosa]|uniref:OLC1v1022635C1 n=1 Tax=Oldenlandia corymbosa var. corymbosa TaxID=529605 RepID=A0AAV1BY90_OLDCO|nr:OLC1v1022635C1 [Oldenlandia corymbosa var. corymbosa]